MTYVFDVSSEHNDLGDVDYFVLHEGYGDYLGLNRRDGDHTIYNVEFTDKRFALQFKLKFNAVTLKWDESDNETIVTEKWLEENGYQEVAVSVASEEAEEFRRWCAAQDWPIVDEIKFLSKDSEPFRVWVPNRGAAMLIDLTWGRL